MTSLSSPTSATHAFEHVRFIMVQPSHPGNVGAAARAIKTMGFKELWLVAPKYPDIHQHEDAIALASGATDVLSQVHIVPSFEAALASVSLSFALTARPRHLGPPALDIRESAQLAAHHAYNQAHSVAIVLGTERTGLSNQQLELCQYTCHIPANPEYSSLNVAQALQLAAWELRYALLESNQSHTLPSTQGKADSGAMLAPMAATDAFLAHLEEALIAIEFLDPTHPKKLLTRIRQLFRRSQLSNDEVALLRGVCKAILKSARSTH